MKLQNTTYNALNMRGLKELPPPVCKIIENGISAGNTTFHGTKPTHSALLHQASASCGRVFLCLFLAMFAFTFVACEKEISHDYPELQAYYTESYHLNVATRDSVLRFTNKVADFVEVNPEAKYDPIYPEIVNNVNHVLFGVWINTEWDGEEHLYY